ncbi:hypothetical protein MHY1_00483 [Methylovirgula sp. HY1]|nr:hypothetical protein MHY1_00483 [Methylovirgula sp. HY1]
MRAHRTMMLIAFNCVALSLSATIVHGQSALPAFSNPYGGNASLLHPDKARAPAQKSTPRSAGKHRARRHVSHKMAHKITREPPVSTSGLAASELSLPASASPPPQLPHEKVSAPTENKDSGLDFGLQWSAADDPHYNTETSTIPALSEIKRNTNETPPETGSSIEGGVNFRF